MNPVAVRTIFRVTGRPADNPLIVYVADPDHVQALVGKIPPRARRLIERIGASVGPMSPSRSGNEDVVHRPERAGLPVRAFIGARC